MEHDRNNSARGAPGPLDSRRLVSLVTLLLIAGMGYLPEPVSAVPGDSSPALPALTGSSDLLITCRDMVTAAGIADVRVYLDGEFQGVTAGKQGSFILFSLSPGEHTVRAVSRGYIATIITVNIPDEKETVITLHPITVIPVGNQGPVEERIDIVFVPSKTQYDCTKKEKIITDYYTSNEENFRTDVNTLIEKRFLLFESLTSKDMVLSKKYEEHFNFYYYSDPGDFADAFNGCAGMLPEDFWEEAPFTDVAVIIYPEYIGTYSGPPCEPKGCTSSLGLGVQTWFKTPADNLPIFTHEAAHAVFGLIDTYCGETYYTQNDPNPNVWNDYAGCLQTAEKNHWDPGLCRQITGKAQQGSTEICQKDFWRYDPEPDIMGTSLFSGKFGNAATSRIRYELANINRWNL